MSRNRGQGQQGKKGGEVRRRKPWRWPRNRERNLLTEAERAQRKLERLMKRSRDGKPGGIMPASYRSKALYEHIARLRAEAKTFPSWL